MKKLLLFALSGIIYQFIAAQDITMRLWPAGKIPNSKKSDDREKWDSTEIVRISKVQDPDISIYLPTKRLATGQAIVICPGGGYSILAYNLEGSDPARMLAAKGIAAIVLKYRLPDRPSNINPTLSPLMDAQRAIRMVRYYAEKWNIKKDRIGIMGFSAGGHLASTAGTHFDNGNISSPDSIEQQSCRPDFMVLVYPVITMSKPLMHAGSRNRLIGGNVDSVRLANYYSSELQVTDQTPPTFLIHAMDDRTVPVENSLMLYQALRDHHIPSEMHIFPRGGHGFGLALGTSNEKWMDLCIDWIRGLIPPK
jgi:acetyl esterase/lipase